MKRFYLDPVDGRKSFYNKCYVETDGTESTLYSYDSMICKYNLVSGVLTKYKAYGYSTTTKRHTRAFINFYNITDQAIQEAIQE